MNVFDGAALAEIHARAHESLAGIMDHLRGLPPGALDRELAGFGYPTIRLQLHHVIGAEAYWMGVLQGRVEADPDDGAYPDVAALEAWRADVAAATAAWLLSADAAALGTAQPLSTWGGRVQVLVPVHVVMRIVTHIFQHLGQVTAMCRLLGQPVPGGLDYRHG